MGLRCTLSLFCRNLDKRRGTKYGSTKALCYANPADAFYTYFSIFPMIRMYGVVLPKSKETSSPVNCMEKVWVTTSPRM
jgi:hypothetical protein